MLCKYHSVASVDAYCHCPAGEFASQPRNNDKVESLKGVFCHKVETQNQHLLKGKIKHPPGKWPGEGA